MLRSFALSFLSILLFSFPLLASDLVCVGKHQNGSHVRVELRLQSTTNPSLNSIKYLGPVDVFSSDQALETRFLEESRIPRRTTVYWSGPVIGFGGRLYIEKLAKEPAQGPRQLVYLGNGQIVNVIVNCR